MRNLKINEQRALEQIVALKQETLRKAMLEFLKTKYNNIIATKEYLIAVGDIPIALVAHLDTVFKHPAQTVFYDKDKNVMWSPDGLGADDRAGVFSILQILKSGLLPSVIFTTDEETGGIGASRLVKDYPEAPMELDYIIELDRQGANDCVFYDCDNPDFEEYIERFGFITKFGTFSDISVICPKWKIAGVNLSIGYVDEHSYTEILYVSHMLDTINKVKAMLKQKAPCRFEYIPAFDYFRHYTDNETEFDWDPSYGVSRETWNSWMMPRQKCKCCGKWFEDFDIFPTKGIDGNTVFYCSDCLTEDKIDWCKTCNEPFEVSPQAKKIHICNDCKEILNGRTAKKNSK